MVKKIQLVVHEDTLEALRKYSREKGIPVATFVRMAALEKMNDGC